MRLPGSASMSPCHDRVEGQSHPARNDQEGLNNVRTGDLNILSIARDKEMTAYPDAHDILIGERKTVNAVA